MISLELKVSTGSFSGSDARSSDFTRFTPPESDIGRGSHMSYAARIALSDSNIGGYSPLSYAARIALSDSDIGRGSSTKMGSVAYAQRPISKAINVNQKVILACFRLYRDVSTNPLPSDYGFIAASVAAQLQHGHVNPLSKE